MATNLAPILNRALKYRSIGPYRGGRVVAVAGHPTDPQIYYFGSTGGGVWKTDDGGITWGNISDGFFQRASIGALAVAASDPNVIYAGMGETTIRSNVTVGDGVYKSTDGGATWQQLGLVGTPQIAKIRIHPADPNTVYVAAFGHIFGESPERGVYRSTDGGRSWAQIRFHSDRAGAIDLAMDPTNPAHSVRRLLGGPPHPVLAGQRRPRQQPLQVAGWRRHLGGADGQAGPAPGRQGQNRHRRLAGPAQPGLGPGRGGGWRPLPL